MMISEEAAHEAETLLQSSAQSVPQRMLDRTMSPEDITPDGRRLRVHRSAFKPDPDVSPFPLRTPNQRFALFNLCHRKQRPMSRRPGVRLLGLFPSHKAAAAYSSQHFAGGKETTLTAPVHQLVPICTSTARQLDPEHAQQTLRTVIACHEAATAERKREFADNVAQQRQGDPKPLAIKVHKEEEEGEGEGEEGEEEGMALSAGVRVGGQRFAVVIILRDIRDMVEKEPLFAVLFATESLEDAEKYAKYTAQAAYEDCDIDIVEMYQWLFPEHSQPDREMWGSEKLDQIMNMKKMTDSILAKQKEKEEEEKDKE